MMLEANGITCRFGALVALDNVSVSLRKGEIHGLIGPNGSGKTTLLNVLSGYYHPSEGQIAIGTRPISGTTVQQRSAMGIARTFQAPRILKTLSVVENVALGGWHQLRAGCLGAALNSRRMRHDQTKLRSRAARILDRLDRVYTMFPELSPMRRRAASQLSAGQQQILAVAQGIIVEPKLLMLDEPSLGLAPMVVDRILDTASQLAKGGTAILLVEQAVEKALARCHRVFVLDAGSIALTAPASEIMQRMCCATRILEDRRNGIS